MLLKDRSANTGLVMGPMVGLWVGISMGMGNPCGLWVGVWVWGRLGLTHSWVKPGSPPMSLPMPLISALQISLVLPRISRADRKKLVPGVMTSTTVKPVLTHTARWTAQGMGYWRLWVKGSELKKHSKICEKI
jgi:hypothetical protein